jgi:uncharacterized protein YuzE
MAKASNGGRPDTRLELDEKGEIMGIEILNAAKSGLIRQVAKAIAETTQ